MAYKPLLDEAIRLSSHKPASVVLVDRRLAPMEKVPGRDHDYATLADRHLHARVECEWLDATDVSYTLYTSGTTGQPKGVQRDVGGYAVALAASMKHIFLGNAGETYFSTSDIGWVVGHSYIVYGPLIAGMGTIMYEGLPIRPDAGVWWSLVEKYKVTSMFSAPTAVRVLKKQDPAFLKKYDLSSLRALFLAGEPLDEPTARWIADGLGRPVIDNYWQTESGWPILTIANGVEEKASKYGSPGVPMYGYDVRLVHESTGEELTQPGQKGVVVIQGPTPPGFMQTVWGDDERYVNTYWKSIPGRQVYSTFDWGIRDEDGYYYILGRTDDVINVAGHRLGTREIEESISSHPNIAEVAVVGVADPLKGQVAVAFAVPKDAPGLKVVGEWDPIGMRGTVSRDLILKDVHVTEEDLMMPRGVFSKTLPNWPHMMALLSPTYMGVSQAAYDFTVAYLRGEGEGKGIDRRIYPTKRMAAGRMYQKLTEMRSLWHRAMMEATADARVLP